MMEDRVALVAGSTGLIGSQLLELLLGDSRYSKVIALSRRPLSISHVKLENVVMEASALENHRELKANDVFCCLGTTIKQAKTKEAFRKIDFDYPLGLASLLKSNGANQFLLVSALGADKNSRIFYNQVKGEVEEAIDKVGYTSYHIFRPSLLIGPRKEARAGEDAAKVVYKIFGFMIPDKYKGIESIKVARAMLSFAKEDKPGKFIHESGRLQTF
jgi:uncharacterized protein YbjT (DUF2867 family)